MTPNKKDILDRVIQWIEIADENLNLAKHAFKMETNVPYRLIGFHSQQCAEKYIKSLLVYNLIDFPYTHEIEKLLKLIPEKYPQKIEINEVKKLSDYAVTKRYPDFYKKLTKDDAEEAVKVAEKIKNFIRDQFEKEGIQLPE